MRVRAVRLFCFLVVVLFIFSAPSLAVALTVSVPGTDIVGELKIDWYEIISEEYAPDSYILGCYIGVSFLRTSGSNNIEDANLRWLQLVSTNAPNFTDDPTEVVHLIDGVFDYLHHDLHDEPFYFSRGDLLVYRTDSQFLFEDMPHANLQHYDLEWDIDTQFELYLVRQLDNETIQPLARIAWGYQLDTSREVRLHTARLQIQNMPSQILKQTLAEDFPDWSFVGASGGDGDVEPSSDGGGDGDGGGGGGCFIDTVAAGL